MAEDLSLLFKIRGDSSGAKQATAETIAAARQLRTAVGGEFNQLNNVTNTVFSNLGNRLTGFASQQIPLVGDALSQLTPQLSELAAEGESAGTAIGAMGGPIGIAVIAAAALTAGVIALGKELYSLTVSTADWQGKLYDLSQQTDVSVETLSTLEVALRKTGSNLDSATSSLVLFQTKLAEAQDPTSKTAELFKKLGITATDTETAFRQALKAVYAMPEGFERVNTAAELFGRRGAKQLLAATNEAKGDLDALSDRLRKLGILLTDDVAASADEFNDQLLFVQLQLRATSALLVKEVTPQILSALQTISKALADNKQTFAQWGTDIGDILRGLRAITGSAFGQFITDTLNWGIQLTGAYHLLVAMKQIVEYIRGVGAENRPPAEVTPEGEYVTPGSTVPGAASTPSAARPRAAAGTGRAAAIEKVSAGQRLLNQLTDEYNRLLAKSEDFTRMDTLALELQKKEYADLDPVLRARLQIQTKNIEDLEKEIELKKQAQQQDESQTRAEAEYMERLKKQAADRVALEERISQAVQDQREALSELQGFEKTHLQTVEEYIAEAVKQAEAVGGVTDKMREYFALLIQIAAKEDEVSEKKKILSQATGKMEGEGTQQGGTSSAIGQLFEHIDKLRAKDPNNTSLIAAQAGVEALTGAFEGLGQAIGQVVQSWVLYGKAGASVRQVTAQILAGVAQQAAVKAVFELAEGFAALALAFFGLPNAGPSAQAHFTAAAIYGSIAGIAAIAGRAVAGNSFNQQGGGGSGGSRGGGGSGGSGSRSGSSDIPTRDINRTASPSTIDHQLTFRVRGDALVDTFVQDYNLNGRTRIIIRSDGQG